MDIIKIDDNKIEVTQTTEKKNIFTYEYLVSQREEIQSQKDRDNAKRDYELAEIDSYLEQCRILNVTEKKVVQTDEVIVE